MRYLKPADILGFVRPSIDAHTLGINYAANLLKDCGYKVLICDRFIAEAVNQISKLDNSTIISNWVIENKISCLGFSCRLDPLLSQEIFARLYNLLHNQNLTCENGGSVRFLYFAGLPETCESIYKKYYGSVVTFSGEEDTLGALEKFGVPSNKIVGSVMENYSYDNFRMDFGRKLIANETYKSIKAEDHSGYQGYGTTSDLLIKRLNNCYNNNTLPLTRAHVGPYSNDRKEALKLFYNWLEQLKCEGLLDIISLGTSQLTQSNFGEEWGDNLNGGGLPINSEAEFCEIWEKSRPMLVRTYAGTKRVPELADIYERTLNNGWHAFSLWWFSQIDGRGPNSVFENLCEHLEAIKYVASREKPFEPNVAHHFSFRGSDDVSYILSAYLAARVAKKHGIKYLILQNMLNTPKITSGVQDLAKSRAMLKLVRSLEDNKFRVILQPRAGLECFSPNLEKAKAQLASVTALMDDIEAGVESSPPIVHVVGYSEASHLADPHIINESIRITLSAIKEYRKLRDKELVPDMTRDPEVKKRENELYHEVSYVLKIIEESVSNPYSPEGLYKIFAAGFLPVPFLWECQDEFKWAMEWKTKVVNGGIKVVNEHNEVIPAVNRAQIAAMRVKDIKCPKSIGLFE